MDTIGPPNADAVSKKKKARPSAGLKTGNLTK
jgi:hypothetical protein